MASSIVGDPTLITIPLQVTDLLASAVSTTVPILILNPVFIGSTVAPAVITGVPKFNVPLTEVGNTFAVPCIVLEPTENDALKPDANIFAAPVITTEPVFIVMPELIGRTEALAVTTGVPTNDSRLSKDGNTVALGFPASKAVVSNADDSNANAITPQVLLALPPSSTYPRPW